MFRTLLSTTEFEAAYSILCEVTAWLLSKGIQQWQAPIPRQIYQKRHDSGQNYGLFLDDALVGVVSLIPNRRVPEWENYLPHTPYMWLGTLATSHQFKGQGLGSALLTEAEAYTQKAGFDTIYLDCFYGVGILPQFYTAAGYQQVTRQQFLLQGNTIPLDTALFTKKV